MSKQTRKEKREEEKRIIAEIEEGTENAKKTEKKTSFYASAQPETVHCRRCRTVMEKGVCPTCGFKMYVPMDPKKRDKIRLILTGIFIAAFVVIFVALQIARG